MPPRQDELQLQWTAHVLVMYLLARLLSSFQKTFVFAADFCHLLGRLHSITPFPRQNASFVPLLLINSRAHTSCIQTICLPCRRFLLPLLDILIQICLKWRKREEEKLLARAVLWVRRTYVSVQIYAETYFRFHTEYRAVHNLTHVLYFEICFFTV